jgi:hypothetical protein
MVAERDADPTLFDKKHPFFGKLLSDESFMKQIMARWERDERRFEYWHPFLWQILNGYENLPQEIGPPPPPTQNNGGQTGGGVPIGGNTGQGGGNTGGGGSTNSFSTPEPSSALLLVAGLCAVLVSGVGRRAR